MIELDGCQRCRFLSKIKQNDDPDGCWEWTGSFFKKGYGQFTVRLANEGRKNLYAHRVAYELFVGPIPDGLTLDHLCRNKKCCRPDHLEPVTNAENIRRAPTHGRQKLSDADVIAIRSRPHTWGDQRREAERYGVTPKNISTVLTGCTFRHLLPQES